MIVALSSYLGRQFLFSRTRRPANFRRSLPLPNMPPARAFRVPLRPLFFSLLSRATSLRRSKPFSLSTMIDAPVPLDQCHRFPPNKSGCSLSYSLLMECPRPTSTSSTSFRSVPYWRKSLVPRPSTGFGSFSLVCLNVDGDFSILFQTGLPPFEDSYLDSFVSRSTSRPPR